jgi:hypothetical protein
MHVVHSKHPELTEPAPPFGRLTHVKAALARPLAPVLAALGSHALEEKLWSYRSARAYGEGYEEGERKR